MLYKTTNIPYPIAIPVYRPTRSFLQYVVHIITAGIWPFREATGKIWVSNGTKFVATTLYQTTLTSPGSYESHPKYFSGTPH